MCLGVIWVGWSPVAVGVCVALYFIRMFAITGFYHRYFSHRSFKTSRAAQFAFAVIGASANGRVGASAGSASADDPLGENPQIVTIRLQSLLESGDSSFNILIHGGDVVSVPRAGIVYVTGAGITQPGGYVLQSHGEQITALKAVALAHGLTGFAKADSAVIMRSNPITGQKDVIPVRIKQIENQKTEDVAMRSNDILYIPDSKGLKILARGAEAAISIGSSVAIYRTAY